MLILKLLSYKGIGRLAAYRLVDKIKVETQPRDDMFGSMLTINWKSLVRGGSSIDDLAVGGMVAMFSVR